MRFFFSCFTFSFFLVFFYNPAIADPDPCGQTAAELADCEDEEPPGKPTIQGPGRNGGIAMVGLRQSRYRAGLGTGMSSGWGQGNGFDASSLKSSASGNAIANGIDGTGTKKPSCANPITISNGNKIEYDVDLQGKGEFPLSLRRTYNDSLVAPGIPLFGEKWVTPYEHRLLFVINPSASCNTGDYVLPPYSCQTIATPLFVPVQIIVVTTNGLKKRFKKQANGTYLHDDPTRLHSLVKVGSEWVYTSEGKYINRFDGWGKIIKRTSPKGIFHTYTYDTWNKLSRVTHSSGRTLDFTFTDNVVTKVIDSKGNQYDYTYLGGNTGIGATLETATKPGTPAVTTKYYYTMINIRLLGKDINGIRYSTFAYDGAGRAILSKHAGDVDKFEFAFTNNTTEIINPFGMKTTYNYADVNGKRKLTDVDRAEGTYCPAMSSDNTYDFNGNLNIETDWKGNKIDYDYNNKGELLKKTTAYGTVQAKTVEYEWVAGENRVSKISTSDSELSYQYDSAGRLASVENKNLGNYGTPGETRKYTYTNETFASGILKRVTIDGPRTDVSDVVITTYDLQGNVTTITNTLDHVTTFSQYDELGNLGRIVDANGLQSDFIYDAANRLVSKTIHNDTGDQKTDYTYNAFDRVTKIKFHDFSYFTYEYTASNRLTKIEDKDGNSIRYYYNNNGDIVSTRKSKTTFTLTLPPPECWDDPSPPPGDILFFVQPQPGDGCDPVETAVTNTYFASFSEFDQLGRLHASIGNNSQQVIYGYDENSNLTSVLDSKGQTTSMVYDGLNQLTQSTDRDGAITKYTYDTAGRVNSVTDARNLKTEYHYSGFGELTELISPDTGTKTFVYNKAGLLVSKTLEDGTLSTYSYDALGRVLVENNGGMSRYYSYDTGTNRKGRLHYVSDNSGQTLYYYDKLGNVTQKRSKIGSKYYYTHYEYDKLNRRNKETYPSGHIVTRGYNNSGQTNVVAFRQNSTAANQYIATQVSYTPFGPLKQMRFGNNLVKTVEHDIDYRPISSSTPNTVDLDYLYDSNNNITKISNNQVTSLTQNFDYDGENRLTSVTSSSGNHTYTYDSVGNRKTHNSDTLSYSSSSNRLTNFNIGHVTTNSNGQITGKGDTGFSYNGENRLFSTLKSGQTTSYTYNALGQRVQKSGQYGTTHYLYNEAGQLIAEHNSSGVVQKEYVFLNGKVISVVKNDTLFYVHNDNLGRAERITDQSQNTVWNASNYAFDRAVNVNLISDYNLGFPGQYYDKETGTYYNYFRDYDASMGRYIQSDPIGLAGGINTYSYVSGNPVNRVDPLGLIECSCGEVNSPQTRHRREAKQSSVTGLGGTGLPGPIGSATAQAFNAQLAAKSQLQMSLGLAPLGVLSLFTGGGLAYVTTFFGFSSLSYTSNYYTAGNVYAEIHWQHGNHGWTETFEYDKGGNQIRRTNSACSSK